MRLDDFIEATGAATTADAAFSVFAAAVAEFGFDRVAYTALRNHPEAARAIIASTYPDEWVAYYIERGYPQSDPVRQRMLTSRGAFLWRDVAEGLPRERTVIFREAAEAGLLDGAAVPIHGPGGECFGIGLASTSGPTDARRHLGVLHLMAEHFHTTYSALARPVAAARLRLTPRETEILQWCARGKSSWAIGEILNIAEHSVEWHLGNVYRKLAVDSRITAVVKAIHLGLIQF